PSYSNHQRSPNTKSFAVGLVKTPSVIFVSATDARSSNYGLACLLILVLVCPIIGAQQCIPNSIPLNDRWNFYFNGQDSGSYQSIAKGKAKAEAVSLPHIFPFPDGSTPPQGFGWYCRDVEIPASFSGNDIFIECDGVCLRAEVYIDGVLAGKSGFAYKPFSLDITPFIRKKTIVRLAVRVDNRLLDDQIPDRNARGWWLYGGLSRGINFVVHGKQRIEKADLRTAFHAADTFDLHISLTPAGLTWDSVTVFAAPIDKAASGFHVTLRGTDTTVRMSRVEAWTPDSPRQYRFSCVPFFKGVPGEITSIVRGFCQLTVRGDSLTLNGKPYFLRGMSRHDVIDGRAPLPSRAQRLRDLADMKSLNVNFVRIAHFPQSADVYELCDSLGLLVMDEIPAWKTGSHFLAEDEGRMFGARYITSVIAAHGNYTCICAWSVGNQINSFKKSVARFVSDVSRAAKKSDPTRLVTFCSYYYLWDEAFSYVDFISINEYFGWELASLDMLSPMMDRIHKDWPDKPVLVSEVGAQSKLGLHNSHPRLAGIIKSVLTKDLSEDHQALFLGAHLDSIWLKRGYTCGTVVWCYADYMSYLNKARTADMPAGLNGCGLVTVDRQRKMSYDVVKKHYADFRRRWLLEHGETP
ncbi:MAG TPA: glycoside hydrolase family 2 TIM barrel-domain containing protein, partial [Chitinivibrionales bacterium]